MAIFITSDLHLSHNRDWLYEPRGFASVHEMNSEIVKRWNSIVTEEDDVYALGDLMLNDNESAMKCLKQLRGNIHIIRGNHDSDERMKLYNTLYNVVEIQEAKHLKYGGYHFFLCHYPTLTANYTDEKKLKSRLINICGHTHTKDRFCDMDKGIIYHAEVDAHNCYPVNIEQIIADVKERYESVKY